MERAGKGLAITQVAPGGTRTEFADFVGARSACAKRAWAGHGTCSPASLEEDMRRVALGTLLALSTACASPSEVGPPPAPDAGAVSLRDRIADRPRLAIAPGSTVRARGRWGDATGDVTISAEGWIQPGIANDSVAFVDLFAELGDLTVSLSGADLRLVDVELTLDEPVTMERMPDGISLRLDWSLVLDDGTVLPLADQPLASMAAAGRVWLEGDRLAASLTGHVSGVVWQWMGFVEIFDLVLDLHAVGGE